MTIWAESLIDLPPAGIILIKATLLLALGWTLYALLLRTNPRWRVLLWRATLVGLLALPVAETFLPELRVAIQRETLTATPAPLPQQPHEISVPYAVPSSVLEVELVPPAPPPVQPQETPVSLRTWGKEHLKALLYGCWALISAALLLRTAITANRVRRAVRQAEPAPEQVSAAAARVAADMNCRIAVDVRVMPNLASPFLAGLRRPVIVLPARMTKDDQAEEWPAVFAHELAHHKAKDLLWLPFTTIAASILWFHPLAWRMCAAHRRACEEVSDAVAADYIGDNRAYSGTLARSALAMAGHMQAPGGLPMIRTANIARRLAKIRRGLMATALPRKWVRVSLATGFIVLGVLSSLRLVQAHKEELSSSREQSDLEFALAQRESEATPQTSIAGPELENPFSTITDPSQLGALRDEAIANGDVIRACDAEMQRVKARDASGNVWKDKIDLVKIYEEISERPEGLSVDEVEEILIELESYQAAHAADPDYSWRVWHLCSAFTRGQDDRSIACMEKAILAYPRVKYAIPSKHSKFQHLVNEMAMLLWDREGAESAENYVLEMWETDRRFVHFHDNPWQQRYESVVGGRERLARLHARMGEKSPPPLERITLILTPEGIRYGNEITDWATLEKTLGEIAKPYDHFLALGITTEDLSLRAWREAQARCIKLVKRLGLDHFSDIGVQQEQEYSSSEEQSDSDPAVTLRESEAMPQESVAWQMLRIPNVGPQLTRMAFHLYKYCADRQLEGPGPAVGDAGHTVDLEILAENALQGPIVVGVFQDPEWKAPPILIKRIPEPGTYSLTLPPGRYYFGAMAGVPPEMSGVGVHESWPTGVDLEEDREKKVRLLLSHEFRRAIPMGMYDLGSAVEAPPNKENLKNYLWGRVLGADGQPVSLVTMQIREHNPGAGSIAAPDRITNADGYYYLRDFAWPYKVHALWSEPLPSAVGQRHRSMGREAVYEGPNRVDFQFEPFPQGEGNISGRFVDQYDNPVAGCYADVSAEDRSFGYRIHCSKEDGSFQISGLPAGDYTIRCLPFDYRAYEHASTETTLKEGQSLRLGKVTIRANQVYYGRLLFRDGTPVHIDDPPWPGAEVNLMVPEQSSVGDGQVDSFFGISSAPPDENGYFKLHISPRGKETIGEIIVSWPYGGRAWKTLGKFDLDDLSTNPEDIPTIQVPRPLWLIETNG